MSSLVQRMKLSNQWPEVGIILDNSERARSTCKLLVMELLQTEQNVALELDIFLS